MRTYVITGPSSCGKTTLAEHLKTRGYSVVQETARQVLEEGKFHPARDAFLFQQEIARRQFLEEERVKENVAELVFFDRGFLDQIAFCRHSGLKEFPPEIRRNAYYDGVFFLEKLPFFESDGVRVENDLEEAMLISEMIKEEYAKMNIPIRNVPIMPVVERAQYILDIIQ